MINQKKGPTQAQKKKFTLPSSYAILVIIIAVMALLTWVVPAGEYDRDPDNARKFIPGTYHTVEQNAQGITDVFMAPIYGFSGKGSTGGSYEIALFLLAIGGFLGMVNKTGAMDAFIGSVVKNSKGNSKKLIPILMIITTIGGTTFGLGEEAVAFYPLVLPIMMATGLDPIVGVSSILLGCKIGTLASTVNPFATGVASGILGIGLGEGIGLRLLILLTNTALGIALIYKYAVSVEKDYSNSLMAYRRTEDLELWKLENKHTEITKTQKKVLALFAFTFILMTISLIPWGDIISGFTFFDDLHVAIASIPVVGKLIGGAVGPLGTWYFQEITMLMLVMAIIIGIVAKLSEGEIISTFMNGARDLLGVALIIAVAKGIQVIMNDGHITATILNYGESLLAGASPTLFSVLAYIFYLPMSFLIPSTSGLAAATMPIIGSLGTFSGVPGHIIVTAYQSAAGLISIITPTSGILMAGLGIGNINYGTWLKFTLKLCLILLLLDILLIAGATAFIY